MLSTRKRTRLFLSHAWGKDELERDVHARARAFADALRALGWKVWFDDDHLTLGHIDAALARAIEACPVFVVLVTRAYCTKVQEALSLPTRRDSCAKEWSCAMMRRRHIVPVIFEPGMLDPEHWPMSAVSMHLAGCMYVDAAHDVARGAADLDRLLHSFHDQGPERADTLPRLPAAPTALDAAREELTTPRSTMCGRSLRRRPSMFKSLRRRSARAA